MDPVRIPPRYATDDGISRWYNSSHPAPPISPGSIRNGGATPRRPILRKPFHQAPSPMATHRRHSTPLTEW
jgi:hypothetical protein